MDIVKQAQEFLRSGQTNPHEARDLRSRLAGEYSFRSGMLQDILARKPKTWMDIRATTTSDKQADQKWEQSDDGINEVGLKMQIKAIEKMMSALKTIVDVQMNERNNSNI